MRQRADSFERRTVLGVALAATGVIVVAASVDPRPFARFFGAAPIAPAALAIGIIGIATHHNLVATLPATLPARRLLLPAAIAATLFAALTIAADVAAPFSRDINVQFPASLYFYPAMGFVAEVVFHLAPLALLVLGHRVLFGALPGRRVLSAIVCVVALVEPVFQLVAARGDGRPLWADAVMAIELLAFSTFQLRLFLRGGFLPMYAMRLVYYVYWHVVWGHLRLDMLF